jgi:signal transduction histidine kinase/ActR/RegA family two-component response regulator
MRDRSEFMLVWPLTILAVATMLLLGASLILGARQIDTKVRQHEEQLVSRAIGGQIRGFENVFAARIAQDEAIARLDNRMDGDWARQNLPLYLKPTIGIWDYLVVDAQDRPQWLSRDATPAPAADWVLFRREAQPIIAELRDLERRRGPWTSAQKTPPLAITRIEPRDGRAYMWMAALVDPDAGLVRPVGPRATMVVAGGFITEANVARIRSGYSLTDARIVTGAGRGAPGLARSPFIPTRGDSPAVLVWTPQRPSHDLLIGSGWIIMSAALALAALGLLMFRRTRKAAHELVEVHRAQREFLANMSHEIRTPLNGVNALADALAKTPLSLKQKEMTDTIRSSGVMLERLLTDILDLARIDASGMALEREAFNLATAVNSVIALMAARARDRGLDLRLGLDPAADALVLGDITRLKQILTNLISNAIKFTDQGHVTLSVRPDGAANLWRFAVADTGIGFDPAVKARLFQRFHQADGSVTRRFGGSGLGLAISRGLAVKMGGGLDAESELGRGAVFTLEIPLPAALAQPDATAAPTTEPPPVRAVGSQPRVLLCEDHPVNRMVIEMQLSEIGAEIVSTENGLEACEAFETQAFDAILMDMQMPVMDGLTAIRRIRERERARHLPRTPIIMVTANALPEHRAAGLAAGADVFITKPVDGEHLVQALEQLRGAAVA